MDGTNRRRSPKKDEPVENFDSDLQRTLARGKFLTEDVTHSDLTKLAPDQLEGRLAYYEGEALFERNQVIRRECQAEADRTRTEINRRKMYARAEADRVFEL